MRERRTVGLPTDVPPTDGLPLPPTADLSQPPRPPVSVMKTSTRVEEFTPVSRPPNPQTRPSILGPHPGAGLSHLNGIHSHGQTSPDAVPHPRLPPTLLHSTVSHGRIQSLSHTHHPVPPPRLPPTLLHSTVSHGPTQPISHTHHPGRHLPAGSPHPATSHPPNPATFIHPPINTPVRLHFLMTLLAEPNILTPSNLLAAISTHQPKPLLISLNLPLHLITRTINPS